MILLVFNAIEKIRISHHFGQAISPREFQAQRTKYIITESVKAP